MIEDVVVDTNVWVHASNPCEDRYQAALEFAQAMLVAATKLCIDPGFNLETAQNRSLIAAEYMDNLRSGMFGYEVVVALATTGRIAITARRARQAVNRRINQLVRNRRDRVFLGVAHNSICQTLVSHDYNDFSLEKRAVIKKEMGVDVIEAAVCVPLCQP